ncbi:recombinase family protein [Rhodococcus sp. 11-3]|uniref:recombinase family protein n=1 Tax=Rhodococcus sp. 11-3 TaxID=2854796 RepID=UPI00203B8D35|nr:recombinase family protein [Rhodococcus sp. 11-3]USC18464.1 recombinase family protein [Rhodococcus sp. 11-3]
MAAPKTPRTKTPKTIYRDLPGGDSARVGYARVSTLDQNLDAQIDALTAAGCGRVYFDHGVSGATDSRPGLDAALAHLRDGDALVITKLDRLGRSLRHLIDTVEAFKPPVGEDGKPLLGKDGKPLKGKQLVSLIDGIDTTTPMGKMMFHVVGAVAEFERDLIRERTKVGLAAARTRGRKGGRKPSMSPAQVRYARTLRDDNGMTLDQIATEIGVSRSSVIRHLKADAEVSA